MTRKVFRISDSYNELYKFLRNEAFKRILLVVDGSFGVLPCKHDIDNLRNACGCDITVFDDFLPNPSVDSVIKGIDVFNEHACDAIFAVGGGSAIDVAKCIKLYCKTDITHEFSQLKPVDNDVKLIALPTTAGTGSEATRYSVVYYNGEKQSVTDNGIIPCAVVLDERVLYTLPDYQKRCTLCDAFFHAVESFWSVNSTEESKAISENVIRTILSVYRAYLDGDKHVCATMQTAAYDAGRAINITQTTAGHAMSYKLTSYFNIAHGHAVALCNVGVAEHLLRFTNRCVDPRGESYLLETLKRLATALGCRDVSELPEHIRGFVGEMNFTVPKADADQIDALAKSVNPVRLKNSPVAIDENDARNIYVKILGAK